MRKFLCIATLLMLSLLSSPCGLKAQDHVDFPLTLIGSHFFFQAQTLQGNTLQIMLESGLPAFLVNRDFYEQNRTTIQFDSSNSKIRLFDEMYRIAFKANGVVHVGEAIYDGPIFVLEDFEGYRMPIQYLTLPSDSSALVLVDLPQQRLSVLSRNTELPAFHRSYLLEMDNQLGFPVVEDSVWVQIDSSKFALPGKLVVDFGNPLMLFLFKQHPSVADAIAQGKLDLVDAYNAKGEMVAQGFFAPEMLLLGRELQEVSVGVTEKMPTLKHLGFLGIPFFDVPVLFDFHQGRMMLLN